MHKHWTIEHSGSTIRLVDSWFGGSKLYIDGDLKDHDKSMPSTEKYPLFFGQLRRYRRRAGNCRGVWKSNPLSVEFGGHRAGREIFRTKDQRGQRREVPMIKVVYCITKRPDMSYAEFFDYWKNVHGPIAARIPGLRRLIQSHAVSESGGQPAFDFDGMAELWFDSWDALSRAKSSREWGAINQDEDNFINGDRVAYFIATEHEIGIGSS